MTSSNDLGEKIALVTGSSTGIGAAIAKELARQGATVILHGRSQSKELEQTATEINTSGGEATCLCCDFSDTDAVESFAESIWSLHNNLDIVINNAGGDVLTGKNAELQPLEKTGLPVFSRLSSIISAFKNPWFTDEVYSAKSWTTLHHQYGLGPGAARHGGRQWSVFLRD